MDPTKPYFQQPSNNQSALVANGWIEQYRRSKMRFVWKEVLASLVQGQKPGEETTLWIQREVINPTTMQNELEPLHQIPLKVLENVSLKDDTIDNQFSLRIYNSSDEFVFRCLEAPIDSLRWVQTLKKHMEIAKGTVANGKETDKETSLLPQEHQHSSFASPNPSTMSITELRAICHGAGINTFGMERKQLENEAEKVRRQGTYFASAPSSGPSQVQTSHQPPLAPLVHTPMTAPVVTPSLSIKELRAICHGAGISTAGMERKELERAAGDVRQRGTYFSPVSNGDFIHQEDCNRQEDLRVLKENDHKQAQQVKAVQERQRIEEEARRQAAAAEAREMERRKHAELERYRKIAAAEAERKKKVEEEARRRALEEEHKRRMVELEAERRRFEEEAYRKLAEEDLRRRIAVENLKQQQEAQAHYQQQQAAWLRQQQEEERRRQQAEQQAAENKRKQEEAWRRHQQWSNPSSQPSSQQRHYQHPHNWKHQHPQGQPQGYQHHRQQPHNANNAGPSTSQEYNSPSSKKYAAMANQCEDNGQTLFTQIKHGILVQWALQPPQMQMLRPIDVLVTTIHKVFPPSFGVVGHAYFDKWKPLAAMDIAGRSGLPDDEKLKKSVRKIRFFLHPDKLPNDLNEQQRFLTKMLWDITSDAWEDHQKRKEGNTGR